MGLTVPPDSAVLPRLLELCIHLLASCVDQALRVGDEAGDDAVLGFIVGDGFGNLLLDGSKIACVFLGKHFEL
jgi:hypothetical protein